MGVDALRQRESSRELPAGTLDAVIAVGVLLVLVLRSPLIVRTSSSSSMSHGLPIHTCNPTDFAGIDGLDVVAVRE